MEEYMQTQTNSALCVDLDGTLIRTDTLIEALLVLARQDPFRALGGLFRLVKGKARFKEYIFAQIRLPVSRLPYHQDLLAYLREERARGRRIVLATATHCSVAREIADHLGIFDEVIATDGVENLRGRAKAERLVERFGRGGFSYAGNDRHDLPVWAEADQALVVGLPRRLRPRVAVPIDAEFPETQGRFRLLAKAMRPYQWVKNILVFVPLLTSGSLLDVPSVLAAAMAFVCFSLLASSVYLFNDLLDLDADRQHERKRHRPFASGSLPLQWGITAGFSLAALALVGAMLISPLLAGVLLLYALLSSAYSFALKTFPLVDVYTLATLYTLRILAGGVAIEVALSIWLLSFSGFFFLALGFLKRYVEVDRKAVAAGANNVAIPSRGYVTGEETPILIMGLSASFASAIILALYVESTIATAQYSAPAALWLLVPLLLFWQCRLWLSAFRGYVHDDPIVYASGDWVSLTIGLSVAAIYLFALFVELR